jgi:NAD(P)-dependent dehydrogenase (short-subunit alcohol dehydrogenase family)
MKDLLSLNGKVALVTGAGSGIGKGAAMWMARAGARVALVGRTKDELCAVQEEIERQGGEAFCSVADVSIAAQIEQVTSEIAMRWGGIDIVFANAGVNGVWAPIEELKPEEFEHTLHNNLTSTFLTIKYATPYLKKQGGSVIVTSSVNGSRIFSNTGATAYSASKAGQVAIAKMLAVELGPSKVRVNVICPGAIQTNISQNTEQRDTEKVKIPVEYPEGEIPLTHGKPGNIDQVGQLVLFLASDASSHVSGTEIFIDGAQSLLQG